jgi:hypothetical protein
MTEPLVNDARLQDAAVRLARAVHGLPPAEAQRIIDNTVTVVALRGADSRISATVSGSSRPSQTGDVAIAAERATFARLNDRDANAWQRPAGQ